MKALVGAFNQEKALVGAFSVIVQHTTSPIKRFAPLQHPQQPRQKITSWKKFLMKTFIRTTQTFWKCSGLQTIKQQSLQLTKTNLL